MDLSGPHRLAYLLGRSEALGEVTDVLRRRHQQREADVAALLQRASAMRAVDVIGELMDGIVADAETTLRRLADLRDEALEDAELERRRGGLAPRGG